MDYSLSLFPNKFHVANIFFCYILEQVQQEHFLYNFFLKTDFLVLIVCKVGAVFDFKYKKSPFTFVKLGSMHS